MRIYESHKSAVTKASEEGEGGAGPGTGMELLLQPMVKTMAKFVLTQPIENHRGAEIYLHLTKEPILQQVDA